MNQYIVRSPIKLRRQIHAIDAIVEMDTATAQRALAKGSVTVHDPREQMRAINASIAESAARVHAGEQTLDQAVEHVTAAAQGMATTQIRAALHDSVRELRLDAERKAKEEADQRAKVEAERKAKEEAERKAKDKEKKK